MTTGYEFLGLETADGIATVTVRRPDKLNALNEKVLFELCDALFRIQGNPRVQAAIVTGEGDRAFVAGADIADLAKMDVLKAVETSRRGQEVFDLLEGIGKPVIAAINGFALGGGCELALACTLRLAARTAKIGLPEVSLGILPGYGGTQRLARLVGPGRALELILTARKISAEEAFRIGLVNEVCNGQVLARAREVASEILKNGPVAVRLAMEAVQRGLDGSLREGLALERQLFGVAAGTRDMREGLAAFMEKRPAKFEGR
ncbi:MAG: enoyl-CoA hydratase/isomerase family protein [Planctomycetes bacterium]|nr:enoyl-CoA hydratase/isomerase family protein [Planctomycetota bacterium]